MKILVTGATGLVGRSVVLALLSRQHHVIVLTRDAHKAQERFGNLPLDYLEMGSGFTFDSSRLNEVEAVIHLAGESVGEGRWTKRRQEAIFRSRVGLTKALLQAFQAIHFGKLKTFISASAVGIYGNRGDETLSEAAAAGTGFLADVCRQWEAAAAFPTAVRTVFLRFGVILSEQGGMLPRILPIFRSGLAGNLGSGKQWMSWIHQADVTHIILYALENDAMVGAVNAVAPEKLRNSDFTKSLAQFVGKPAFFHAPSFMLRLALGKQSELLLDSQRVSPDKLLKNGYRFRYGIIEAALHSLIIENGLKNGRTAYFFHWIPKSKAEVFPFFAKAENLESITPDWLNFRIEKPSAQAMCEGTEINYRLKLHGIPLKWSSRIESWNPPHSFRDIQTKGPYKEWNHQHQFTDFCGGTLMEDHVRYRVPAGVLGDALVGRWVEKDVQSIFAHRSRALKDIFKPV